MYKVELFILKAFIGQELTLVDLNYMIIVRIRIIKKKKTNFKLLQAFKK
jgi:hypothetical protein